MHPSDAGAAYECRRGRDPLEQLSPSLSRNFCRRELRRHNNTIRAPDVAGAGETMLEPLRRRSVAVCLGRLRITYSRRELFFDRSSARPSRARVRSGVRASRVGSSAIRIRESVRSPRSASPKTRSLTPLKSAAGWASNSLRQRPLRHFARAIARDRLLRGTIAWQFVAIDWASLK